MKLDKCIKVKKYTSNHNLAKIEKWLRIEASNGKKLIHVKSGVFKNTYYFIEAANCDEVYFAPADFAKIDKYSRTTISVLSYLQTKHGAKKLSPIDYCLWIRLSKSKITNIDDIKANLMIREKCIRNQFLQWLGAFLIETIAFAILSFFEAYTLLFAFISFVPVVIVFIQLLLHRKNCKEIYTDFLND